MRTNINHISGIIACILTFTIIAPAWAQQTDYKITGYYYDPATGKILPKYEDMTPKQVLGYLYIVDHPQYLKTIQSMNYNNFRTLDASFIGYLTPAQIASIPNTDWFNTLSAEQKASLSAEQIMAINTSKVSIGGLTAAQREFLTNLQITALGNRYSDFRYLPADKIKILDTNQIASIPNTDWFNTLSADQKAAFTTNQVRAIDTAKVSIGALPETQRTKLTNQQITNIGTRYSDLRYVPADKVPVLSAAQIAAMPNTDWFNTLSDTQKLKLTPDQVHAINTATVSIGALPAEQRANLTTQQISSIGNRYSDYRYVPVEQIPTLSTTQIASIPNTDWFNTLTDAIKKKLTPNQIQAVNTATVSIGALPAEQRANLTTQQISSIGNRYSDYRYVPVEQIPTLSTTQIASIPNTDWFNTLTDDIKKKLTPNQVQAVNTTTVSIGALPDTQRANLTTQQISSIGTRYSDYRYVPADKIQTLSTTQIASIPNADWFNTLSTSQVQNLNQSQVSNISISYYNLIKSRLTTEQRIWRP